MSAGLNRMKVAAILGAVLIVVPLVFLFVPLVGVQAEPLGVVFQSTTTTTEGNQTRTMVFVYDWPTESSVASLSYCFWGSGALFQNGTYHPFVVSHTLIGGEWCPAIKP